MDNSWDELVSVYLEWSSFDHLSLYKKIEDSISWMFLLLNFTQLKICISCCVFFPENTVGKLCRLIKAVKVVQGGFPAN